MADVLVDGTISQDEGYHRPRGIVSMDDGLTVYAFVQNATDVVTMYKSDDAGATWDGGTTINSSGSAW